MARDPVDRKRLPKYRLSLAARRALLRSPHSLVELGAQVRLDPADVSRILHAATFGNARKPKVELLVRVLGLDPSVEIRS